MSLAINVNRVKEVLLADGWHKVSLDSFGLDAYEYVDTEEGQKPDVSNILHGGGQSNVCATGFCFLEEDTDLIIAGPLTAILAIKEAWRPDKE